MDACYECKFFKIMDGYCTKHTVFRHSCGAEACDGFELAEDLKQMRDNEKESAKVGK